LPHSLAITDDFPVQEGPKKTARGSSILLSLFVNWYPELIREGVKGRSEMKYKFDWKLRHFWGILKSRER
jgi:hypothetical protein